MLTIQKISFTLDEKTIFYFRCSKEDNWSVRKGLRDICQGLAPTCQTTEGEDVEKKTNKLKYI